MPARIGFHDPGIVECAHRYHLMLFPCRLRSPVYRRHWWRAGLAVVLLLAATGVGLTGGWLADRAPCRANWRALPDDRLWQQDGECVGVSDATYTFGLPAYTNVFARIAGNNGTACGQQPPVTVGVLMPLNAVNVGARGVHELEGFATAQAIANSPENCRRPIRLLVGNMGAKEQAAIKVAGILAADPDVVAAVGMGLSDRQSALATEPFAKRHIPMVADLISAEGFDRTGSVADHPDFSRCEDPAPYRSGVGDGFFSRVSFRDAIQQQALKAYVDSSRQKRVDMILTPTDTRDPSPCTGLALYHRTFGDVHDVKFTVDDPATMDIAVKQVCNLDGDLTVVYAARGRDQTRFLGEIANQHESGVCKAHSITIIEGSDGSRIRSVELDKDRESLRRTALTSPSFRTGYLSLIITPLADRELLSQRSPATFTTFRDMYTGLGFADSGIDDGWAINAYDALTTVAAAIGSIELSLADGKPRPVTPDQVNSAIGAFSRPDSPVPGAVQSPLYFDNDGNRAGTAPAAVRICPPTDEWRDPPPQIRTAPVGTPCNSPTGG